jgi:PAS domain S-box-containing protein
MVWLIVVLGLIAHPFVVSAEGSIPNVSSEQDFSHHTVLFASTSTDKAPIFNLWKQGITEGLAEEKEIPIDLVVESSDISRYNDPFFYQNMVELYRYKLEKLNPDLIFTFDQVMLNILLETNSTNLKKIPIITTRSSEKLRSSNILLIPSLPVFSNGTISLALNLFPDTKRLVVIAGSSSPDIADTVQVRETIDLMNLKIPVEYLTNQTVAELEQSVAGLPNQTVIYYIKYSGDSTGNSYIPAEVLRELRKKTDLPIFGGTDTFIGNGIVGGYIPSTTVRGHLVARTIRDYLHGKNPGASYFDPSAYMRYMFDWREVVRLGIDPSQLPIEAEIFYREETGFERYYWLILLTFLIIGVETALVAALLINRRNRILAEQNMRESEERFRVLVEQAPEAILVVDRDRKVFVDANKNAERLFGYSKEELLQHGPGDFYATDLADTQDIEKSILDNMDRALSGEKIIVERMIRKRKGDLIPCEVRIVRLPSRNNNLIRLSYIDITVHKQTTEELERRIRERTAELHTTKEAFRQANIKLNLLSGITRHDILNGITGLLGYLEICLELHPGEKMKEYLEKCIHLTGMIQSQIEFTRIYEDIGTESPKWQRVLVIMHKIQEFFPYPLTYILDLDDVEIYADPLLEKVFYTLVENTIRHAKDATEVRVSYVIDETGLLIRYEDNGSGIPVSEKKKIFEKGFGKNTGFGLFISREILSITQLTIQENGEPGKGVRFEIRVPQGGYRSGDIPQDD